jgi:thioredoxin-dependent peroxiredoxin
MASSPQVGDPAPDFTLEGTEGTFRLSDHLGERVVLLFYPGDETAVCTRQFCSYRDRADDMAELDALVVGVSPQDVDSHHSFMANHSLTVPLLADPDRSVARAYGVARGGVTALVQGVQRAVFIIDEDGIVGYRHVHAIGLDFQTADDLRDALDSLPTRA